MKDPRKKTTVNATRQNVIESLKDLGSSTGTQITDLIKNTSNDFFRELIGIPSQNNNISREIAAGEEVKISQILSDQNSEIRNLKTQVAAIKNMESEQRKIGEERMVELRIELQAIATEIIKLASATQNLAQETEIAMIEVPKNPGIYHKAFFEKILEFVISFRKKIEDASIWLKSINERSKKRNYWSMYKKKGSSFLLSPDHYLQRSAG